MTIQMLAHFYVYDLVPLLEVLAVLLAVIFVLQLFNFMSGKDKKFPLIDKIFTSIIKLLSFVLVGSVKLLAVVSKMLLKYTKIIFDTFKDFFTSPI